MKMSEETQVVLEKKHYIVLNTKERDFLLNKYNVVKLSDLKKLLLGGDVL